MIRFPVITAITCLMFIPILTGCSGGGGGGSGSTAAPVTASQDENPPESGNDAAAISFTRLSRDAGLDYVHGFLEENSSTEAVAGVAVGDYDGDGWLDLYIAQGDTGPNLLYHNRSQGGDYQFEEVAAAAGVGVSTEHRSSGPAFADFDGDGDEDLFVGSIQYDGVRAFSNDGDGTFSDITAATGLDQIIRENNVSLTFGDYDQDGLIDLFIGHWTFTDNELPPGNAQFLWRNNGDGTFTDTTNETMIGDAALPFPADFSFTPTFADIDNDGDLDMLLVSDENTSQVLLNQGDAGDGTYTFVRVTDEGVITDEAGMGSAVADFDNDGDLDWFVSSIEEQGNRDRSGNRYYRNDGTGVFSDATDAVGVRSGYWGWAACAADFNNDMHLDIFHVNGIGTLAGTEEFVFDPSRLFMANGDGTFTEMSESLGIEDPRQGRGIVCFDGDRDGDVDIFIANNGDGPSLFRNDGGNSNNWVNISLDGPGVNSKAYGARIYLQASDITQMREVMNGNNYVSQNPAEQHFGLAANETIPSVRVVWPDGMETQRSDITANQRLTVTYPDTWSTD